jgi:RNA polymerase sigma factor (sigma-70 family)
MGNAAKDEKDLLQQVSEGNESAFRELFFRYADLIGRYVLRFTHSKIHAEEIVQDVFLKIWMSREALAAVENFRAYLFVVSRNQTLNAIRKELRQISHQNEWKKNQIAKGESTIAHEREEIIHLEGLIEGAISQLPFQQQRAWLLSRKEGLTHPQIAIAMGISRETVKKYIMYANHSIAYFIRSKISTPN